MPWRGRRLRIAGIAGSQVGQLLPLPPVPKNSLFQVDNQFVERRRHYTSRSCPTVVVNHCIAGSQGNAEGAQSILRQGRLHQASCQSLRTSDCAVGRPRNCPRGNSSKACTVVMDGGSTTGVSGDKM